MNYQVHKVEWDDEKVKRFWDFHYHYEPFEQLWFTRAVGRQIIQFASRFVKIEGSILDYGIGKGHLTNYLLENSKLDIFGCDFSNETVINTDRQFGERSNFKGCILVKEFPSNFSENQFDLVFLVEAIEHLTDNYLVTTLAEINRILKPGGSIVVTTPNEEILEHQNVVCPDCGCVFHRVQHVRDFESKSLDRLMKAQNFDRLYCDAIDLTDLEKSFPVRVVKNVLRRMKGKSYKAPHLIYIGKKK